MDDLINNLIRAKDNNDTVNRVGTSFIVCDRALWDNKEQAFNNLYTRLAKVSSSEDVDMYKKFFEFKEKIFEHQRGLRVQHNDQCTKLADEFIEHYAPRGHDGMSVVTDMDTGHLFMVQILGVDWIKKANDPVKVVGGFFISTSSDIRNRSTLYFTIENNELKVEMNPIL